MRFGKPSVLLFLLALLQICFAQEKQKAELIDKFGELSNDSLQARTVPFIQNVMNSNSKGYFIIYGTGDDQLIQHLYERRLKGCFRWSELPVKNFVFSFGEDRKQFEVELWKVGDGADNPQFVEKPRNYVLSKMRQPQKIYQDTWAQEYCPLYFDLEFYSKFLQANPSVVGKIIIYEKSLRSYQKVKQKHLGELTKKYKVSPQQIKFVRGKFYGESDLEFWLVPQKK